MLINSDFCFIAFFLRTVVGFPLQICAKTFCVQCVSTERCYIIKAGFSSLMVALTACPFIFINIAFHIMSCDLNTKKKRFKLNFAHFPLANYLKSNAMQV